MRASRASSQLTGSAENSVSSLIGAGPSAIRTGMASRVMSSSSPGTGQADCDHQSHDDRQTGSARHTDRRSIVLGLTEYIDKMMRK